MSPTHTETECPACSIGTPCRVATRHHTRYWDLYLASPAKWGPVLIRDAKADQEAGLATIPRAEPPPEGFRPMAFGPVVIQPDPVHASGLPPCQHRSSKWVCSEGRTILNCALGKGQAGIIESDDCRSCDDASTP